MEEMITEKSMKVVDDKLNQVVSGYAELRPGELYSVELYCHECGNHFWVHDLKVPKATGVCPRCGTTSSSVFNYTTSFG